MKLTRNYKCILLDADDTLIDFATDAKRAFLAALEAVGGADEETLETCIRFDYGNWDRIGLCNVHLPEVQAAFHRLYRDHVREIFEHADKMHDLRGRMDTAEQVFMEAFGQAGHELEGARETVAALRTRYGVYAATNGLTELQCGRLRNFALDGVFVSEAVGTIKPSPKFFAHILRELNVRPEDCLMVGDSLHSDVAGANAAGIDAVWVNRTGRNLPDGMKTVAVIQRISELLPLLGIKE